jgi:cytochrome P450
LNTAPAVQALADALYDLAVHPEYILPMREEAERVIAAEGCTKAALGNLHKIDSFLRESMRLTAPGPGTQLPKYYQAASKWRILSSRPGT